MLMAHTTHKNGKFEKVFWQTAYFQLATIPKSMGKRGPNRR